MARLMVVDDEKGIREALVQVFEYDGHQVRAAEDGPDALLTAESFHPDVIFLDVKMPGMDGLDVLARLHTECPGALVVMISGHGTIETAIEATHAGAYDFLEKPLDTDRLLVTLGRALELKGLTDSIADLRSQVESRYEIIGTSYQVRQVLDRDDPQLRPARRADSALHLARVRPPPLARAARAGAPRAHTSGPAPACAHATQESRNRPVSC